ncbi:MAG: endonuclease domain-containing protein, partial [Devosia sp.]
LTPTLSPQGRGGEGSASPRKASTSRARALRLNSTDAERRLWAMLRGRQLQGHKFVRQLAIGPFFADFACREMALIIEVDGGQHAQSAADIYRTAYLTGEGYTVLRFWNTEVLKNAAAVCDAINSVLSRAPRPDLRLSPAVPNPGKGLRGAIAATSRTRSVRLTSDPTSEPHP